jgi:hypothetical protein
VSITHVRRYLASNADYTIAEDGVFEGHGVRIETRDDGILSVSDPDQREPLLAQLRDAGIDLAGVREPVSSVEILERVIASVAPLRVTPATARRQLIERAEHALGRWCCGEVMGGLFTALLPEEALDRLSETDALVVLQALASLPVECAAFIERFDAAVPGRNIGAAWQVPTELLPPAESRDLFGGVLRRLWPNWEGWHDPEPRQHLMDEYVFDVGTSSFWDSLRGQPLSDAALDASIPRHLWYQCEKDGRIVYVPPSRHMKSRDSGYVVGGVAWLPGRPLFVRDLFFDHTGPRREIGARLLNRYRPPPPYDRSAGDAGQWLDLVHRLVPDEIVRERVLNHFAYKIQNPGKFINGVVALVGEQGVGKDAFLQPIFRAVGRWNVATISASALVGRFNPWAETVFLNINENRIDFREGGAHGFYTTLKMLTAVPPETIGIDEKNVKVRHSLKTASLLITSNEITSFYVPADDRRYLLWLIPLTAGWHIAEGMPDYFESYFCWLENGGGYAAVARWLHERDLSSFNPNVPMPLTESKRMAQASTTEVDTVLSHAIERLGDPDCFFLSELRELADATADGERDHELHIALRNTKALPARLEDMGYMPFPHPHGKQRWRFSYAGLPDGTLAVKLSRTAYIKKEVLRSNSRETAVEMMEARGARWVRGGTPGGRERDVPGGLF